jgi:hypothetical protein
MVVDPAAAAAADAVGDSPFGRCRGAAAAAAVDAIAAERHASSPPPEALPAGAYTRSLFSST